MCEARLNVYLVCMGGAAASRLAAVLLLVAVHDGSLKIDVKRLCLSIFTFYNYFIGPVRE